QRQPGANRRRAQHRNPSPAAHTTSARMIVLLLHPPFQQAAKVCRIHELSHRRASTCGLFTVFPGSTSRSARVLSFIADAIYTAEIVKKRRFYLGIVFLVLPTAHLFGQFSTPETRFPLPVDWSSSHVVYTQNFTPQQAALMRHDPRLYNSW